MSEQKKRAFLTSTLALATAILVSQSPAGAVADPKAQLTPIVAEQSQAKDFVIEPASGTDSVMTAHRSHSSHQSHSSHASHESHASHSSHSSHQSYAG
jgi:hypothetical protein